MSNPIHHSMVKHHDSPLAIGRIHQDGQYYLKDMSTKLPLYFEIFNGQNECVFTSDFSKAYHFETGIEAVCCWKRIVDAYPTYKNKLNINWKK